jgi:hypothetical protein
MNVAVSNCRCGELVFKGPQSEIDKMVRHLENDGVNVKRDAKTPEPLGIPVMNFDKEPEEEATTKIENRSGTPEPLGIPVMQF